MEDPEEGDVPFLSLFRVSLDDYPSHRPPGGRGGPAGPREQAGTMMPLLWPGHLGAEVQGCGDPRLTAQRGRGSGFTGTGRPAITIYQPPWGPGALHLRRLPAKSARDDTHKQPSKQED